MQDKYFKNSIFCCSSKPDRYISLLNRYYAEAWMLYNSKSQKDMANYNYKMITRLMPAKDPNDPKTIFFNALVRGMVEMSVVNLSFSDLIPISQIPEVKANVNLLSYYRGLYPDGFFAIIKATEVKNIIEIANACNGYVENDNTVNGNKIRELKANITNTKDPHGIMTEKNPVRILYNFFTEVNAGLPLIPAINVQKALTIIFPEKKYIFGDLMRYYACPDEKGIFHSEINNVFAHSTTKDITVIQQEYTQTARYTEAANDFNRLLNSYNMPNCRPGVNWPSNAPEINTFGANIDDISTEESRPIVKRSFVLE